VSVAILAQTLSAQAHAIGSGRSVLANRFSQQTEQLRTKHTDEITALGRVSGQPVQETGTTWQFIRHQAVVQQ
jgi:hypothetical protein